MRLVPSLPASWPVIVECMLHTAATVLALLLLAVVLVDAFQTIILPRRPVNRLRITRLFFYFTWTPWSSVTRRLKNRKRREQIFSVFGPLSLLMLFALWALLLLGGFALLYFGLHTPFTDSAQPASALARFRTCLYVSGTTLFTLGLGDVVPTTHLARALSVLQAGLGLAYLGMVVGYVPVLYNTFSHREVTVALLDSRAGSPPTAGELLARHSFDGGPDALDRLLEEWERWAAEMLETHVSYPILCFYRSQHDNQSWLAAVTAILDACALLITTVQGRSTRQAELTFAMARHTLIDLGHVFHLEAEEESLRKEPPTRLQDHEYVRLCDVLAGTGVQLCSDLQVRERLLAIRQLYEPVACALANRLQLELPHWAAPAPDPARKPDVWKSVAGLRSPAALKTRPGTHVSAQSAASRLDDDESHST